MWLSVDLQLVLFTTNMKVVNNRNVCVTPLENLFQEPEAVAVMYAGHNQSYPNNESRKTTKQKKELMKECRTGLIKEESAEKLNKEIYTCSTFSFKEKEHVQKKQMHTFCVQKKRTTLGELIRY